MISLALGGILSTVVVLLFRYLRCLVHRAPPFVLSSISSYLTSFCEAGGLEKEITCYFELATS